MFKLQYYGKFKSDLKRAKQRGLDLSKLESVVHLLLTGDPIPVKFRDHALTNSRNYKGVRELHITSDWLLVYRIDKKYLTLILIRTGTHSDLF